MTPLWLLDCWVLLLLLLLEFGDEVMQGCGDTGMWGCRDAGMQGCGDAGQRPQMLWSLALLKRECLTEDTDFQRKLEHTTDHLDQCLYTANMWHFMLQGLTS